MVITKTREHHAWDIYAEQLIDKGYGYPLWYPDQPAQRQIHLGDVGWIQEGEFVPLFNTMKPDLNLKGAPSKFKPFGDGKKVYTVGEASKSVEIQENIMSSRSVRFGDDSSEILSNWYVDTVIASCKTQL